MCTLEIIYIITYYFTQREILNILNFIYLCLFIIYTFDLFLQNNGLKIKFGEALTRPNNPNPNPSLFLNTDSDF